MRLGWFARVAAVLAVALIAVQLIHPKLANPPVRADLAAPPDVERILRTSCYDCHSNETRLRWFDRVAPAYWMVVEDVEKGRAHLNFSELGDMAPAPRGALLYEGVNQVEQGAMPPRAYTLLHPGAVVTAEDRAVLEHYLHPQREDQETLIALPAAVDPNPAPLSRDQVRPSASGLAFVEGYEDWKAMASTDRFDNGTLRVILANDTAIRAVEDDRIDPWPDGSAFAKVTWNAARDSTGVVRAASFKQVEFMVKDAGRFGATEGWNWGRWVGLGLVPYGATSGFVSECTGCHAPMRRKDFVFSLPIHRGKSHADLFNGDAALPQDLPAHPLEWKVIASSIDKKSGTMSTVYGNDSAVDHSRTGSRGSFPPGSVVARVTWTQREDPDWFGGRIPGRVKSVEFVTAGPNSDGAARGAYQVYGGDPLAAVLAPTGADPELRGDALLDERASVMPVVGPPVHGQP